MKKDMLQETEEQQFTRSGHVMQMEECRIEPAGETEARQSAADQSTHGSMGLGTASKGDTSRMKSISIESSGGGEEK
jgi:hypothetical protein